METGLESGIIGWTLPACPSCCCSCQKYRRPSRKHGVKTEVVDFAKKFGTINPVREGHSLCNATQKAAIIGGGAQVKTEVVIREQVWKQPSSRGHSAVRDDDSSS
jgi:hypothetical protein